ncbi:MAG: hypothetical protein ACFHU9_06470 [Fluviicola sp.]
MKARILYFALFSFLVMSFALPQNWEKLGSRKVNFGIEKDTIAVGAHEGAFTKLKIQVTGGALNMKKMVVHYRNGDKQDLNLKHNFGKGSGSRVIDLAGNKRLIQKITFIYDTKNRSKRRATVHVFGRH